MIELSSDSLTVRVNTFGAELVSVKSSQGREFIWQAGDPWNRHAPVLFPIVGRLNQLSYHWGDNTYSLNQHGFARDSEFSVVELSENHVILRLCSSEKTWSSYPFKFEFDVVFRLNENLLSQEFVAKNTSNKDEMAVSFGAHPAFNISNMNGWSLQFNKAETAESDTLRDGTLSGVMREGIVNSCIDLRPDTFEMDAMIFRNLRSDHVTLLSPMNQPLVEVEFSQFPYLGIWAKPNAPFVCIEPWQGVADSWNHDGQLRTKEGIMLLDPLESVKKSFSMKFYV